MDNSSIRKNLLSKKTWLNDVTPEKINKPKRKKKRAKPIVIYDMKTKVASIYKERKRKKRKRK